VSTEFLLDPNNREKIKQYIVDSTSSIRGLQGDHQEQGGKPIRAEGLFLEGSGGGGDGIKLTNVKSNQFPFTLADKQVIQNVSENFVTDMDEAESELKLINEDLANNIEEVKEEFQEDVDGSSGFLLPGETIDDQTQRLIMAKCTEKFPKLLLYDKDAFVNKGSKEDEIKERSNLIKMLTIVIFGSSSKILCYYVTSSLGFTLSCKAEEKLSRAMDMKLLLRYDEGKRLVIANTDCLDLVKSSPTESNASIKHTQHLSAGRDNNGTEQQTQPRVVEPTGEASLTVGENSQSIDNNNDVQPQGSEEKMEESEDIHDPDNDDEVAPPQQNDQATKSVDDEISEEEQVKRVLNNQFNETGKSLNETVVGNTEDISVEEDVDPRVATEEFSEDRKNETESPLTLASSEIPETENTQNKQNEITVRKDPAIEILTESNPPLIGCKPDLDGQSEELLESKKEVSFQDPHIGSANPVLTTSADPAVKSASSAHQQGKTNSEGSRSQKPIESTKGSKPSGRSMITPQPEKRLSSNKNTNLPLRLNGDNGKDMKNQLLKMRKELDAQKEDGAIREEGYYAEVKKVLELNRDLAGKVAILEEKVSSISQQFQMFKASLCSDQINVGNLQSYVFTNQSLSIPKRKNEETKAKEHREQKIEPPIPSTSEQDTDSKDQLVQSSLMRRLASKRTTSQVLTTGPPSSNVVKTVPIFVTGPPASKAQDPLSRSINRRKQFSATLTFPRQHP